MPATLELSTHADAPPIPRPWSLRDAANELNISERYLGELCAEGKVRSIKFGRRRLIPDATVRRLAEFGIESQEESNRNGTHSGNGVGNGQATGNVTH
jgi:excisionase family DNA binding protein